MPTDVIILGGGAAGLAAATRLAEAGRRVELLEARDRLGGRIDTRRAADDERVVIERGAEFVHGRPRETWQIVDRAHLKAIEISEEHRRFDGAGWHDDDSWQAVEALLARMESAHGRDESFAAFLAREGGDLSPAARAMAVAFVEGFNAADQHRIGTLGLAEAQRASDEIDAEQSFRLPQGYDQLIAAMAEELPPERVSVHTGVTIESVRWQPGNVEVTTNATTVWRAPAAIITLPLGVLQAPVGEPGAVRFEPPLAEKRWALDHLVMGPVVKVVLQFRDAFWRDEHPDLSFVHALDEPLPTWWTQAPEQVPLLTGWAGGPAAERLSNLPDDAITNIAIATVSRIFQRDNLRTLLVSAEVCNWQRDPLSRGAYSYVAVDGLAAVDELAKPIAKTLYFAGEATHRGFSGTVSGALASGYRAADEILTNLQSPR